MCPGNNESGGKHRSGKTRKGSKWLRVALTEAAKASSRSKGTYLSAQYNRLRGRRGPAKAAYHLMDRDQDYADLGADYFIRRHDLERHASKLVRQLKALGYEVNIQPVEAA